MAGITRMYSVAAFPLRTLQKQNSWLKRRKSNMKGVIGVSIAYWRVCL